MGTLIYKVRQKGYTGPHLLWVVNAYRHLGKGNSSLNGQRSLWVADDGHSYSNTIKSDVETNTVARTSQC